MRESLTNNGAIQVLLSTTEEQLERMKKHKIEIEKNIEIYTDIKNKLNKLKEVLYNESREAGK